MCISDYSLMHYFSLLLPYISFIFCTCWVSTISVLNLIIFPRYSNLLLRRRRCAGILRRGVLGYASPRLPFLWCYGVFHCSVLPRVTLVFKDINYVIIILYIYDIWLSVSTFGRMCGTIDTGSCIRWVLSFGIKIGYDRTSPLGWGGLRCYHISYDSRPCLPAEVDSDDVTCPIDPHHAPWMRWAPALPRVLCLQTLPLSRGGLQRSHVSYGSGPHLSDEVGSGAVKCTMAPFLTFWFRWAPALPRIPRFPMGHVSQA
jgi:hypothetical protein